MVVSGVEGDGVGVGATGLVVTVPTGAVLGLVLPGEPGVAATLAVAVAVAVGVAVGLGASVLGSGVALGVPLGVVPGVLLGDWLGTTVAELLWLGAGLGLVTGAPARWANTRW